MIKEKFFCNFFNFSKNKPYNKKSFYDLFIGKIYGLRENLKNFLFEGLYGIISRYCEGKIKKKIFMNK